MKLNYWKNGLLFVACCFVCGCVSGPKTYQGYLKKATLTEEQNVWIKEDIPETTGVVYSQRISFKGQPAIISVGMIENAVLAQIILLLPFGSGISSHISWSYTELLGQEFDAEIVQANPWESSVIIVLQKPLEFIKLLQGQNDKMPLELMFNMDIYSGVVNGNLLNFLE